MILCITPNPAVDRTILLPHLVLGNVHRAQKVMVAAGGKGFNVARAIRILGSQPLCMGFAGGHSGRQMADLARDEGLQSSWTWTDAETRTCTILVAGDRDATLINEPGLPLSTTDWKHLLQDIDKQLPSVDLACISGSLPPHSSAEDFQHLLHMLVDSGRQVWVDTSGAALNTALAIPQVCIKVNGNELGEALEVEVNDFSSAGQALDLLGERAPTACVITLGSAGAVLATRTGRWFAKGPQIRVVSTVGSGDSFLGGLVSALDEGADGTEALRSGVAAGTANALSAGGGRFAFADFQRIREQIQIQAW
jgi:1-phosphofructokinase family hexose kinase